MAPGAAAPKSTAVVNAVLGASIAVAMSIFIAAMLLVM